MAKKKKINRSERKYPNLDSKTNLRIRADLYDQTYASDLSEENKEYLNKFNSEFINADFRHEKPLHKSKKAKRERFTNNNKRNHCVLSKAKAQGLVTELPVTENPEYDGEDSINELLDKTKKIQILIVDMIAKYDLPDNQNTKDKLFQLFIDLNFNYMKVNAFMHKHYGYRVKTTC